MLLNKQELLYEVVLDMSVVFVATSLAVFINNLLFPLRYFLSLFLQFLTLNRLLAPLFSDFVCFMIYVPCLVLDGVNDDI